MTLKQRLQDAAEYAPDAAPPPALAMRALSRLSAQRRTQKRRNAALLAATTAAVCLLALWAARPVSSPPAPQRVASGEPLPIRFVPRHRPIRHFRSVRHFRPVRRRPLLTVARLAPSPTVEPIVKAAPKTMVVPIVVAQISDDGASLVLTPAAVVITPAASQSQTE